MIFWGERWNDLAGKIIVGTVCVIALLLFGFVLNLLSGPCDEICEARRDVYSYQRGQ